MAPTIGIDRKVTTIVATTGSKRVATTDAERSLRELFYERRGGCRHTFGTAMAGAVALWQFVLIRMALNIFRTPDTGTLGYSSVLLTPVVLTYWALAGVLFSLTATVLSLLVMAVIPYSLLFEGTASIVRNDWNEKDEGWSRTGGHKPKQWDI